jgi:glycosyltransferase involved in cell wall biosynthesis
MLRKEFFERAWSNPSTSITNIVSVISSPVYKGHDNIIEACKVMTRAGITFRWHVIGIDKNTFAYNLFYKAHALSMKDTLCFHGQLASQALIDVLLSASVYVHPSHIENSSNAICEAMALGMPVIALDVGGNTSIVRDGEDGLIIPDNDPYSLAAAIKKLVTDIELAQMLGAAAKVRALARHDQQRIVAELKKVYSELVSPHAS